MTVTLTGKTGARTAVTDAEGSTASPPSTPAPTTSRPSSPASGREARGHRGHRSARPSTCDFTLKVGGLTETVDVVGESPVVDITSSATDNNALPGPALQHARSATATPRPTCSTTLPGINNGSAYGGDADSGNALLIDGVDTRDPDGRHGLDLLQLQHRRGGPGRRPRRPAEYGSFTGAVVNTITKSGGNRYAGLFDVNYTNERPRRQQHRATRSRRRTRRSADPAKTNKLLDFTTQLGGPADQGQAVLLRERPALPPEARTRRARARMRDEVSPRFNGKLTWQPSANDNVTGHVQYDSYNIIGRAGVAGASSPPTTSRTRGRSRVGLAHPVAAPLRLEDLHRGQVHRLVGLLRPQPRGARRRSTTTARPALYSVSQGWAYSADRGRNQVNASISHFAEGFGHHDLKFGVEIERSKMRDRYGYTNDTYYYDYGGAALLRLRLRLRHQRPQPPRVGLRAGLLEAERPPDPQPRRAHRPHVAAARPTQDAVYTQHHARAPRSASPST